MKKGFTLIELLAVMVILAIIAVIAVPMILNIVDDTKESAIVRSADFYLDALENEIAIENMQTGGTLSPKECIIGSDGNATCDSAPIEVNIDGEKPTGGSITFEGKTITNVNLIYTNGMVMLNDKGSLEYFLSSSCSLISGEENAVGSKYECEVKKETNYNFFVLSHNEDGTTNLIMERNICEDGTLATKDNTCVVAWTSKLDYNDDVKYGTYGNNSKGPITAMNFLYNATKDWDNIPNISINYLNDGNTVDNGYKEIKTKKAITKITDNIGIPVTVLKDKEGYINLKARMPYYSEVSDYTSDNAYLYDYLLKGGHSINIISGIYGYWTLTSDSSSPRFSFYVAYNGNVEKADVSTIKGRGVRPVITVKL